MDIQLHYVEKGQGMPLILLHGNGEDGGYFKHQIDHFSGAYRVIAIDTRGHGQSSRGFAPFTIRQFAEDLYNFMEEKKIEKAHILGFSDGGNIAMVFAMEYPQKVEKLILNGANLYGFGVKPLVQIPIILGYRLACFFERFSAKADAKAQMLGLMVNDPALRPEELKKIKARTLVIAGTRDMIKEKHTKLIFESLTDAKLVLISGNHFIAARQPEEFNREVEMFLKEKPEHLYGAERRKEK